MNALFADTGYWIALLLPSDEIHEKAVELSASLGSFKMVTSELDTAFISGKLPFRWWMSCKTHLQSKCLRQAANCSVTRCSSIGSVLIKAGALQTALLSS